MSKRNRGFRVQADKDGLDELVVDGLVHVEAQAVHCYLVVLGEGPSSRRFVVRRSRNKDGFEVVDQDEF